MSCHAATSAPRESGSEPGSDSTSPSFSKTLSQHGVELKRDETSTLQINVGLMCNQTCRHCHLEAGPRRKEIMSRETMDRVVDFARRCVFPLADITGGAPEMNPYLGYLIERIAPFSEKLMLRSNLSALAEYGDDELIQLLTRLRVAIVASFPAVNEAQTDSQRGTGVWGTGIDMLKKLNELGYGRDGTGLELDLVSNPAGAFLPTPQEQAEARFKRDLMRKFGIVFNRLFTFANVPLGRFRTWLEKSGNLDQYMERLSTSFNPCTLDGLMCRSLISISWDGHLFDCDFNLARGLYLEGHRTHVSDLDHIPERGTNIATGDHCYACTAGSGFT